MLLMALLAAAGRLQPTPPIALRQLMDIVPMGKMIVLS
jgi:hypothetical protein